MIDQSGTKIFEVEKEELIFTLEVTKKVEEMVSDFNNAPTDEKLITLGKFLENQILRNTKDNSKKFNLSTEK